MKIITIIVYSFILLLINTPVFASDPIEPGLPTPQYEPNPVRVGETLSIRGAGFGELPGVVQYWNAYTYPRFIRTFHVISWNNNEITLEIPQEAYDNPNPDQQVYLELRITTHSLYTRELIGNYLAISRTPSSGSRVSSRITNVYPNPIRAGDILTVQGIGFGNTPGEVEIWNLANVPSFGNSRLLTHDEILQWSDNELRIAIPNDLASANISHLRIEIQPRSGIPSEVAITLEPVNHTSVPDVTLTVTVNLTCGDNQPVPNTGVLLRGSLLGIVGQALTDENGRATLTYQVDPLSNEFTYEVIPHLIGNVAAQPLYTTFNVSNFNQSIQQENANFYYPSCSQTITGGGLHRGGLLGAPGGSLFNGLFPAETPPSRTITSIKINGEDVDLTVSNPQLRLHLPVTEGVAGPVVIPVEITYDEVASDGSKETHTYPTYLAFNYLNDFTQIELPSTFSQSPSPSSTPFPSLPPNTPRCGLTANDSNVSTTIAVGNYITFKLTNIPDGAVSASWLGSGGPVPANISGFERGPNGSWNKIYGPYGSDTAGRYSRQVVVYDGAGSPLCQSNRVNIIVLSALSPRGIYTQIGSSCGVNYPPCDPANSVCSSVSGKCELNYSVPTRAPVGVIATPTPIPLTAPSQCYPGLIGCQNNSDCGTGNCGLRCILGGGPNNTNVCR